MKKILKVGLYHITVGNTIAFLKTCINLTFHISPMCYWTCNQWLYENVMRFSVVYCRYIVNDMIKLSMMYSVVTFTTVLHSHTVLWQNRITWSWFSHIKFSWGQICDSYWIIVRAWDTSTNQLRPGSTVIVSRHHMKHTFRLPDIFFTVLSLWTLHFKV